jgi:hypothetical protein
MAKKDKTPEVSNPEIYKSIIQDKKFNGITLVEDVHGQFFVFPTPQANHLLKEAVHKVWAGANKFLDENKNTITCYHENIFKCEAPKGQDLVTTGMWVWYALCSIATKRLGDTTPKDPVSGRKSTIGIRKYTPVKNPDGSWPDCAIHTPQAKVCLTIVRESIDPETGSITENDLKAKVLERQQEIKTRQDPWRIFQYYRPSLINAGLLKHD